MGMFKKKNLNFHHTHLGKGVKGMGKGVNKVANAAKHNTSDVLQSGKRTIGQVGKFTQKNLGMITEPLTNLTKSPITFIIILGLGAFIVMKVTK